jgi:polyhydroxybutyrate depolymerase
VASIVVGGDRPVTVQVPLGYDRGRPAPLLIGLHGFGSSGTEHANYFHIGDAAAQRGFLVAWPNGTLDSDQLRFWNATDACCDHEGSGVDDAGYLAGLITEIETKFAVDPKRIDVLGHSNGAFMSYAMACKHADTIAAIVSLAGATFANRNDCTPKMPVAVLEIHGTSDDAVLFAGGTLTVGAVNSMAPYPGAETSIATWAKYDGCLSKSAVDEHVDVDSNLGTNAGPAEAIVMRWSGCKPGGAAELWTIPAGSHSPDLSDAFPGAVLDFLEAHPKP